MSTDLSKLQLARMKITKSTDDDHGLLLCFYFQVIILWGLILFLIWLILAPNHPTYKVVDVYLSHSGGRNSTLDDGWNSTAKSTSLGGSSSKYQNISIILKIEISNPNKKIGINHDDIKVALYDNDTIIGNNSIAGFHQGYRNTTIREVGVKANRKLQTRIMSRRVDLRICLKSRVQYLYDIFKYRTVHHQMDTEAYMSIGLDGKI